MEPIPVASSSRPMLASISWTQLTSSDAIVAGSVSGPISQNTPSTAYQPGGIGELGVGRSVGLVGAPKYATPPPRTAQTWLECPLPPALPFEVSKLCCR